MKEQLDYSKAFKVAKRLLCNVYDENDMQTQIDIKMADPETDTKFIVRLLRELEGFAKELRLIINKKK